MTRSILNFERLAARTRAGAQSTAPKAWTCVYEARTFPLAEAVVLSVVPVIPVHPESEIQVLASGESMYV